MTTYECAMLPSSHRDRRTPRHERADAPGLELEPDPEIEHASLAGRRDVQHHVLARSMAEALDRRDFTTAKRLLRIAAGEDETR